MAWYMKHLYLAIILLSVSAVATAAPPPMPADQPQRTPEEMARKQTMRLVRELSLTDSVVVDSIYRINLRHNKRRAQGLTRAEEYEGMKQFVNELQGILTPAQFESFMNHKADTPRHPHASYMPARTDSTPRRPQAP